MSGDRERGSVPTTRLIKSIDQRNPYEARPILSGFTTSGTILPPRDCSSSRTSVARKCLRGFFARAYFFFFIHAGSLRHGCVGIGQNCDKPIQVTLVIFQFQFKDTRNCAEDPRALKLLELSVGERFGVAIELHVFISGAGVPTACAWQEAINRAGFPAKLDTSVEVQTHAGFWPASYKERPTGFEFYLTPATDFLKTYPRVADRVGDRTICATFRWGGSLLEMCIALSAAAALTKLTDGIYFYPDDDIVYGADEAVPATHRDLSPVPM